MADVSPAAASGGGLSAVRAAREARWRGEGYADITKLRELSAKHERQAAAFEARIARVQTKIEKLRHTSTVLREKAQKVLARIPEYEQEMVQHERNIKAAIANQQGRTIGSDVTGQHYRIRQLQQKIVDLQHRARKLEHRAAVKTQQTAALKVRADRYVEQMRVAQQEAENFRKRADRLQLATEGELAAVDSPAAPPDGYALAPPAPVARPPSDSETF
jgi:chromosome segregation ATPase